MGREVTIGGGRCSWLRVRGPGAIGGLGDAVSAASHLGCISMFGKPAVLVVVSESSPCKVALCISATEHMEGSLVNIP